jgi:Phosphotransferase enzyme family
LVALAHSVLTERAVRAATHVAHDHGLAFADEPRVLHEGSNVLLHLHPAPVVARVATTTAMVRPGDAWLTREVAVAGHAAAKGAPVVAPSMDVPPGPHHFSGLTMTFWTYVKQSPERADPVRAGHALRDTHDALRDFPDLLPRLALIEEAERIIERFAGDGALPPDDAQRLREAATDARRRIDALELPMQTVHGDAHLGNVINTAAGPLWGDFEDTCLAPTAWDLGCLLTSGRAFGADPEPGEAAVAAYGSGPDDAFIAARRLQGTVWSLVFARDHPEQKPLADRLLAHYRPTI